MTDGDHCAETLSKRELEVASAYASGDSYKEIARTLGLSPTTVRTHLRTVYTKLGVTSKIELARFLDDKIIPDQSLERSEMTADLALELDDAIRRERSIAKVLKIISDHDGNLDTVIDAVLDHALEICEAEFGILFEYQGDMKFRELRSRNISPEFADWLAERQTFQVEAGTGIGRVASDLQTINIADVRGEDIYRNGASLRIATADLGKARSFAAIPMISGGRLIGAFTVYRTRVHPFNDRALELAAAFADQAVIAIENVRQFREVQNRLEREAASREILGLISANRDDENPVFRTILENACRLCEAKSAFMIVLDETGESVFSPAQFGASPEFAKIFEDWRAPYATSPLGAVVAMRERRVVAFDDLADTDLYRSGNTERVNQVETEGIRSLISVPLLTDDKAVGALILYRTEVRPFSDENIALVETFAAQAAIAIENVRQFRELQRRLEREAATREILEVISESRDDAKPVFEILLGTVQRLCNSSHGAIVLGEANGGPQVLGAHTSGLDEIEKRYENGDFPMDPHTSLAARAIIDRKTLHFADLKESDPYQNLLPIAVRMVEDEGISSSLYVPLISNGVGIGCFNLHRQEKRGYSVDEIALVETFAAQAVIAIENVRQFKALESLNTELGERVEDQVGEIERMGRLKRFLSPAVADALISSGDDASLSSHRALIATLFCDIRGFTAFCERAEPEETIEVLQAYHEEMGILISAHGGGVDKRMGDGIMVIFNDPLPCEDPAGSAVRLAIAMRARMGELCTGWKRLGHRLGFGVGISLGYATIGMVGSEGRYDYTASGTSVNLAARLCDRAGDGEILLSPRAYTAIEDEFDVTSSGEIELKGLREPIEVFRLTE